MNISSNWIDLAYLVSAVLFILGIKGLTKPKTAVAGNRMAALGALIAIVATLLHRDIVDYRIIIGGAIVGGLIGFGLASKVKMTAMPQLIAVLNGFGGGASVAIALAEYFKGPGSNDAIAMLSTAATSSSTGSITMLATTLAVLIGAVTLTGSIVAFAKLQELISGQAITFPGNKLVNALLVLGALGIAVYMSFVEPGNTDLLWVLLALTLILGLTVVLPVGGADMPVVIALLNSYSGLAVSSAGFMMGNYALIITGALVGASGLILTQIMCKAMNRSLANVLFGGNIADSGPKLSDDEVYQGKVKSSSADEIAMLLEGVQRVVIVPGFGMAMAQAQHAVRDLATTIESMGAVVEYAIHPVAGRMPGHMNVLLAEAEVPYDQLKDMDTINPTFEQTDVVIVIGANDVTNPMAREDKGSPIYGMPILDVDKARTVVVVKRSLSSGFAGLPNPLYARDNCLMLFGDGKQAILDINASLKEG